MEERTPVTVFFVSDHTGITAEVLGHSLLARFEGLELRQVTRPFIDSAQKAQPVVQEIEEAARNTQVLVFTTLTDRDILQRLSRAGAVLLDLFEPYLDTLAVELGRPPSQRVGRSHSIVNLANYQARISALDFALVTDDGLGANQYQNADIVLVGVSRVGKTPTCLYLGLQYGIRASNYPLADDDFERPALPEPLAAHQHKLFGLSIDPLRLHHIRNERRPGSSYASLERCQYEVRQAERLFQTLGLPFLNTTTASVEEIAATILQVAGLRRLY
ncbi:MAG TPA: pyruvate, water dikinase regulatory protein [Trueperaceae bacterium]